MKCYICNADIDDPQFNADHEDYDPCDTCLAIIADAVGGQDKVAAGEDDLPDEDPLYGLYSGPEDIEENEYGYAPE